MHILFLSDNFPPEGNAPASRTFEHTKEWVKKGHKVTVITCAPNFPEGVVYPGYKNSWYSKTVIDGINVVRVKTYMAANTGFAKRILDYLSFMLSSFCAGIFAKKVDIVIATSPQFFTAISGYGLSAIKSVPFVFELRDIWPASITAVGAMQESKVIKLLEKIELFLYRKADLIVSVTEAFKTELIGRGVNAAKIKVVRNGVDLETYQPAVKDPELSEQYDLDGKFVVGYIGTHGLAHGLSSIVGAAKRLSHREDVVFLFAGGGAGLASLQNEVQEAGLKNVRILGRIEKKYISRIWSLCDVSLVHLKNTPLFKSVIPSKIFEAFGMGLPTIIGVPEGEATAIVKEHQAGLIVAPENEEEIACAVLSLADDGDTRNRLSDSAIKAALRFNRPVLAEQMLTELIRLNAREL